MPHQNAEKSGGDRPVAVGKAGPVELAAWPQKFEDGLTHNIRLRKWYKASGSDDLKTTETLRTRDLGHLLLATIDLFQQLSQLEKAERDARREADTESA